MKSEEIKHFQKRRANIRFVYNFCNDVKSISHFYTDILALCEMDIIDTEDFVYVNYDTEGMQYMFFRWDSDLGILDSWAWLMVNCQKSL